MFKINPEEIMEGWLNYFHLSSEPIDESIAKVRAEICADCPSAKESNLLNVTLPDNTLKEIQGYKCTKCGCPLSSKVRSKLSQCPEKKWPK